MIEIPLTQGKVALIDDEDFELVSQYKWYAVKDYNTWYSRSARGGSGTILMHRLLMQPGNMYVDHINHNGLDNQRSNLRIATPSQNLGNSRNQCGVSSRYKGVSWYNRHQKWLVTIKKNGNKKYLGYFENEIDAALAYNEAANELFGEFASLNDVEVGMCNA